MAWNFKLTLGSSFFNCNWGLFWIVLNFLLTPHPHPQMLYPAEHPCPCDQQQSEILQRNDEKKKKNIPLFSLVVAVWNEEKLSGYSILRRKTKQHHISATIYLCFFFTYLPIVRPFAGLQVFPVFLTNEFGLFEGIPSVFHSHGAMVSISRHIPTPMLSHR